MRKGTTSSQNNKEQQEKKSVSIKLNTQNPNHLVISLELLGIIHKLCNAKTGGGGLPWVRAPA